MISEELDQRIIERGRSLFKLIQEDKPSLLDKNRWIGKIMDWVMQNNRFKYQLYSFIDLFPSLKTSKAVAEHVREYFPLNNKDLPPFLKFLIKIAIHSGPLGRKLLQTFITFNINTIGKQFIIGETTHQAIKTMENLREKGYAFTITVLGEMTQTEAEGQNYQDIYLSIIKDLGHHKFDWNGLSVTDASMHYTRDWGYSPIVQISLKISCLVPKINLLDFENSVNKVLVQLKPIYKKILDIDGALYLDMESYYLKSITLEVFRRLRSDEEFKHHPHLGIVLQAYLQDSEADLDQLIEWGKNNKLPFEIRLVKGAYWDYENIVADQNNWTSRVWLQKSRTDAAFEELAYKILRNHNTCYLACGSHNIRSIAAVWEMAKELGVPESHYEFQLLYGMAEPIGKAILDARGQVRFYCPYGNITSGMGYLIRRLLENASNESFLRQNFVENLNKESLLKNPKSFI